MSQTDRLKMIDSELDNISQELHSIMKEYHAQRDIIKMNQIKSNLSQWMKKLK